MCVYLLLPIKLVDIKIYTKRKMEKEEKHQEVGNSNMTMSHKKDGKL
jgi:DNA-binding Xre family transcriptional regulator